MQNVLEVDNLTKYYGKIRALHKVSFTVPEGTVFGILGPNGSGKTTLLGIMMNVLLPTEGRVLLLGESPSPAMRKRIGTLLETPNFYHYLSAVDNLKIAATIKGITNPDIDGVLKQVTLYERRNSPFSSFSLGMKQRLAIASALLGNPEVLVFDEPTNGLDPNGIAEIRTLIKDIAKQGKTIIMASHMLDEVEKVCTHVAILKKGETIATGHVDEILAQDDVVEVAGEPSAQLMAALQSLPAHTGVYAHEGGMATVHFKQGTVNLASVNRHCFEKGVVLSHLVVKRKSLEMKFMELTN